MVGAGRRDRTGQPSYGARVAKPQTTESTSGPKPMDIDHKMSQSLDDIIKQQRTAKKPTAKMTESKPKNRPKKDQKSRPIKNKSTRGSDRRPHNTADKPSNLQITVRADKIRERPVLNQIISNAELFESQRASRNVAPRLRERVQPVSLDYKVAGGDSYHPQPPARHHHDYVEDRQGGHRYHGSSYSRVPPPASPMNIDSYYQEPMRPRRY